MAQNIKVESIATKPGGSEKKKWVLTTITDDKGAKFSGFDAGLAKLSPGAVIEAEVEIDGQYHNIKKFKVIEQGTPVQASGAANGSESPEKTASIEAQSAVSNVMKSYTSIYIGGGEPPARLIKLWEKALDWCDSRISVKTHPPKAARQESTVQANSKLHFSNAGEFLTAVQSSLGKNLSDVLLILGLSNISEIKDFDKAFEDLKKKTGK